MSDVYSLLGVISVPVAALVVVLIDAVFRPEIEACVHIVPLRKQSQPAVAYSSIADDPPSP